VWIVPGVAFDSECRRLGRGKGVYDRLLERVKGFSIGVFYEAQKCGAAPSAEHDRRLDAVVTEETVRRRT
jgi:5-formyltetrahydrofolate cyclo-ligase